LLVTLALEHWLKAQPREYTSPRRGCYKSRADLVAMWERLIAESGFERMPKAESVND
jgi:hypothetical protein